MKKASRLAFLLPIVAGVFWGSVGDICALSERQ